MKRSVLVFGFGLVLAGSMILSEPGPSEKPGLGRERQSATPSIPAPISSLSRMFQPGTSILDKDGDGFPDAIALRVIIPDSPTAYETALASDIAGRANLESLVLDLDLVRKESEFRPATSDAQVVFIGPNLKAIKDILKTGAADVPKLTPDQGLVILLSSTDRKGVWVTAGSAEALLKTGRAFFLRWPYLWDIWGREEGATYSTLENNIMTFLIENGLTARSIAVRSAMYEFPTIKSPHDAVKRLNFGSGEIKELTIILEFSNGREEEKAVLALAALENLHRQGKRTDVLSYAGCAGLTFVVGQGRKVSRITLPRMGVPARFLTPPYKSPARANTTEKDFDLLDLFNLKGFYTDADRDGIPDGITTTVVVPSTAPVLAAAEFASRLMLPTAGASFPLISLDGEVENPKSLLSPVLIGPNALNQELDRTGKLKVPPLEKGWGTARVVPKALNRSSALSITGADDAGLDKTLRYLSRTFPFFEEYKDGTPQIADVPSDLEKFFKGEMGSAEAFFEKNLKKLAVDLKDKEFDSFKAEFFLPRDNPKYVDSARKFLQDELKLKSLDAQTYLLRDSKRIFDKEKEFPWEADEAVDLIKEKAGAAGNAGVPLSVRLALSESPRIREQVKSRIESALKGLGIAVSEVEVLSAYKQGFFWLTEHVLPRLREQKPARLLISFAQEKEDFSKPKRSYSEPVRWLQELYPVDEILARNLGLPLENIDFEMKPIPLPVYEVKAFDAAGSVVFQEEFSPRIKEIPYMKVLPEWGTVKITTGWLEIKRGDAAVFSTALKCDLEKFWDYYQDEVLAPVYSQIMKKTGNEPTTSKQPYFKRLQVEMWFSEPDYRLGLDEEVVSSLEAMHDELYFDTLDLMRGITDVELEERDQPEDTQRLSAPGNVMPVIHPSTEGGKGRVKVVFDDWQASTPQLVLKWKEKGREEEISKRFVFPSLKSKSVKIPSLIYNGAEERVETLSVEVELNTENEYLALLDILENMRGLSEKGLIFAPFEYPRLKAIALKIKSKDVEKDEMLAVAAPKKEAANPGPATPTPGSSIVPEGIISPETCLEVAGKLGCLPGIRSYIGGKSYEGRLLPVLEVYKPQGSYVSLARLMTFKPTLLLLGRQHANEVSSTSYILKLAELLATDEAYKPFVNKVNLAMFPMENADGAALAYELQKMTPFHSLHAGRYSSLGVEIGSGTEAAKAFFPEAIVLHNLSDKWLPDISLNLHGYPSHEWIQQFSNYVPFLFREYWIPKGWFLLYSALRLPIYDKYTQAGQDLLGFITREMQADGKISASNRVFSERFRRWANRWQPHLDYLELYDGFSIFTKRRSTSESRLSDRTKITFSSQTPELMDETAQGEWLGFLIDQGLAYLRAHLKYLSRAAYDVVRIEESSRDKVSIQFVRGRPGRIK